MTTILDNSNGATFYEWLRNIGITEGTLTIRARARALSAWEDGKEPKAWIRGENSADG